MMRPDLSPRSNHAEEVGPEPGISRGAVELQVGHRRREAARECPRTDRLWIQQLLAAAHAMAVAGRQLNG